MLNFFVIVLFIIVFSDYSESAAIGERFHEDTSHTWKQVLKDVVRPKPAMPPQFKEYKGSKTALPKPLFKGITVEEALVKRRSIREYTDKPLSLQEVSQLFFAAQGITGKLYGTLLRTAPSAGALYPFEIYLIVNNVNATKRGIYHYSPLDHSIVLIKEGDFRKELMQASLSQEMMRDAGIVIVLSAIFDRMRSKYGERGYRYVYMEAGYISQNIYLQATSLGLGSVVVGAFIDKDINNLIGVDGKKEAVIALHAVGAIKK
jgi:SagB-type dehydrogenase family enzyme